MKPLANNIISWIFPTLFILSFLSASGQEVYFPPNYYLSWEEREAGELGLDSSLINEAIQFAIEHEYSGDRDLRIPVLKAFSKEPYHQILGPVIDRGGPAGIILKDGYIIAKWGDIEKVDMTFSVTKSYLSTVAGLAWDNHLIPDLHAPVKELVWDGTFEGEHNAQITWVHLLTQSSDWSGELFGMYDWADRPEGDGGIDTWRNRNLYEPGTHFKYNDVRVNVLAYALLQVWRKPLPVVLKEYVMDEIGASPTWRWMGYDHAYVNVDGIQMQSVSGGGHSGGGMFINTLDQARFGLLFQRNGNWKGKQIISNEWVKKVQQPSAANESYGYMWWLLKGEPKIKNVPDSIYYAAGFGGNFIVIDNEHQMVLVTRWLEPAFFSEWLELVLKAVND
jgi:CubicO group peptidase (beta-lactamase class C family)